MKYFLNSVKLYTVLLCMPLLFTGCLADTTPPTIQEAAIKIVNTTPGKYLRITLKATEHANGKGIYEWGWHCNKANGSSANASNSNGSPSLTSNIVNVASTPKKYDLDETVFVSLNSLGFPASPGVYNYEIEVIDYAGNEMWKNGQFVL